VQANHQIVDVRDLSVINMNDIRVNAGLQTFPKEYEFVGMKANVIIMIASAVPPSPPKKFQSPTGDIYHSDEMWIQTTVF
jgi:hypothetical protein